MIRIPFQGGGMDERFRDPGGLRGGQMDSPSADASNRGNRGGNGGGNQMLDKLQGGIQSVFSAENMIPAAINALVPGAGLIAMAPRILGALGFNVDVQPSTFMPERGGNRPEPPVMVAQPVTPFANDAAKLQRYQEFMQAGYPADMAEYLVNQLA
tara:strand:+ start:471 stop:935 length:465 start_codon:yes stop_codon:yes gene_type:complete